MKFTSPKMTNPTESEHRRNALPPLHHTQKKKGPWNRTQTQDNCLHRKIQKYRAHYKIIAAIQNN